MVPLAGVSLILYIVKNDEDGKYFHLCKWRFIGDVPFQYRERGLGGPPMLGSPLAPARGTDGIIRNLVCRSSRACC
jgi:hypothetical protein